MSSTVAPELRTEEEPKHPTYESQGSSLGETGVPHGTRHTRNEALMEENESRKDEKKTKTPKTKSIGHYILGRTLGEGTFGKVKLGTHILTDEKVAVKILEKDRISDVADVERVTREIHILKIVRHPCIIQLYEIIETQKQLYLIMEYANGGELFDYIVKCTRVKEKEACRFFQQLLSGVEYIHRLKIVHRDLKPENLLLDFEKRIKLVDFGLSNTYKEMELLKTACGSPCYAAPEMIAGKKYKGLMVDLWSCGVILFALLCGYLPFQDPNTAQLYKKILNANYSIPRFVSAEAKDLMQKILNTDPDHRFTVEDVRNHPWYNQQKSVEYKGIVVGEDPIPIDQHILNSLEKYKFNLDYVQKCLECNKHNHATTSYYLLLKKHLSSGGKSPADISSDSYDPSLFRRKPIMPLALTNTPHYPPISFSNKPQPRNSSKLNTTIATIGRQKSTPANTHKRRAGSTGGSSSKDTELTMNTRGSTVAQAKAYGNYRDDQLSQSPPRQFFQSLVGQNNGNNAVLANMKASTGSGALKEYASGQSSIYSTNRSKTNKMATTVTGGFGEYKLHNSSSPERKEILPSVTKNQAPVPPSSAKPNQAFIRNNRGVIIKHRQAHSIQAPNDQMGKTHTTGFGTGNITLPMGIVSPRSGTSGTAQLPARYSQSSRQQQYGAPSLKFNLKGSAGDVYRQGNSLQLNFDGNSFSLHSQDKELNDTMQITSTNKSRLPTGVKQGPDQLNKTSIMFKNQGGSYPQAGKPITASTKTRLKKIRPISRGQNSIFVNPGRSKQQAAFRISTLFTMYRPKVKDPRNKTPMGHRPSDFHIHNSAPHQPTISHNSSKHGQHYSMIQGEVPSMMHGSMGLPFASAKAKGNAVNHHAQQAYNIAIAGMDRRNNSNSPRALSAMEHHISNFMNSTMNAPFAIHRRTNARGGSQIPSNMVSGKRQIPAFS